jgi:amino acid transporter
VPYTDPNLLGGNDVNASPFVVAVKRAGISALPDVLNAIILICVISVGTTSLYASARMLMYLSTQSMAPRIFGRTDCAGRPIPALMLTSAIGIGLSYLNVSNTGAEVFGWFSSLSGTAFFMFWLTIFICNWRWRAAQKAQGINVLTGEPFAYVQWGYPYTPIIGFILVAFMLICNGYTAIWPLSGSPDATHFFATYLGVPVFIAMWAGWKVWHRTWWFCIRLEDVDLQFERRMLRDHPEERAILEEYAEKGMGRRVLSYVSL